MWLPASWFLTSGLQNCDKIHSLVKKRRERRREYKLPKVYENITCTYWKLDTCSNMAECGERIRKHRFFLDIGFSPVTKKFEVAWQLCWLKAQRTKKMIKRDKNEQNQSLESSLCRTWCSTCSPGQLPEKVREFPASSSCQARGRGYEDTGVQGDVQVWFSCWEHPYVQPKIWYDFLSLKEFWLTFF